MCVCVYAHTYHKKIKLFLILGKSKIKIFELLFYNTLFLSVYSNRCKLATCNSLRYFVAREVRFAYVRIRSHESIKSLISFAQCSLTHLGVKIVLFCVLCLICYPSSPPQPQKHKNTQKIIKTQN